MKNTILFFTLFIFLLGCEEGDILSSADRNVVFEEEAVQFEELLILINIKISDSTFLVVNSVDSVNIYINSYYWSKISSESIDTAKIDKYFDGNKALTKNKLNYLIIAGQDVEQPDFTVAGDFAQYLNSFYELKAGEYACFIESFQVTFNDNTTEKYFPQEYKVFKVEEGLRSAFVGEIELKIK